MIVLGAIGSAPASSGTFALQAALPKTKGHLVAREIPGAPLERSLDFWMSRRGESAPIRRYDLDMTKRLHLVIVSDDFRTFVHAHPRLGPNGHFRLDQRFGRPALYHLYFDGEPHDIGQQVFRFDVPVGRPRPNVARDLAPTGTTTEAGPYSVTLSRTRLGTRGATLLDVRIDEHGKPARDLHPYLGTLAHAVFLDARDLTYVHVHPMAFDSTQPDAPASQPAMVSQRAMPMNGPALAPTAAVAPDMLLHVEVREAGTYKLWFQFRGGDALRVASFVLSAN